MAPLLMARNRWLARSRLPPARNCPPLARIRQSPAAMCPWTETVLGGCNNLRTSITAYVDGRHDTKPSQKSSPRSPRIASEPHELGFPALREGADPFTSVSSPHGELLSPGLVIERR